jgi:hypothetical protein
MAVLTLIFTAESFAGGPVGAVGTTARRYPSGSFPLSYRTDQGGLGAFSNATATSIANYAFAQWDNVSSAALSFSNAGQLGRDVTTGTDAYISGNGQYSDGVNPVVFDSSGAITDAKLGTGAKSAVLGFAGSAWSGTSYVEGYAIINGFLSGSGSTNDQDYYKATITHEIGHFLGLGHSQVSMHGAFATLYPVIMGTAQKTLSPDDTAAIANLYPATGYASSVGSITGTVKRPNNTNLSGVNVIAEDSVSGAAYSTVVDYFSGSDVNRFSSQPTATGSYTLSGLPPGKYFVRIEPVKTEFSGGSALASYSTPSNTTVAREWYNGGSEGGDMLLDNTNQKSGVTVSAGSAASGINFVANESATLSTLTYHNGTPSVLFALPQGNVTKYATKFTAPSNGSLLGIRFRVAGISSLPLAGTLTISVHSNASGSTAGIPGTLLGSVAIPFSDIAADAENEIWLRGIGTAMNFNNGDNFHVTFSTSGGGTFYLYSDDGSTTQNRSSYYQNATWSNFPGGYSAGYNFLMSAIYTTTPVGTPQPVVSLNPTSLDFGRKRPGDSLDRSVTLTNSGTATLNVTGTPVIGRDSTSFTVVSNGGAFSLAAGASRIVTLRFKPLNAGGSKIASLSIVSNATSSPNNLSLSGMGVEPTATKLMNSVAFNSRRTGGTYNQTTSILRNTGNDTLHIGSLALTGSDAGSGIRLTSSTSATILAPDSILRVDLQFLPTQRRSYAATLTINHDDSTLSSSFTISGSGIAPVVTPAVDTIATGNVRSGTTADTSFYIHNSGDAALIIGSIAMTGADSSAFQVVAPVTMPVTVAAGDSLRVQLRFAPKARRTYSAIVHLAHDASPAVNDYLVTGKGTLPILSAPATFQAGSGRVGSSIDPQRFNIFNNGDAPLLVTGLNLSGANAGEFTVVSSTRSLPATIAPGDSLGVQLRFQPAARGSRIATLSILSNATPGTTEMMLEGTGLQGDLAGNAIAIDFGDVLVNASLKQTMTVMNSGNDTATIGGVEVQGTGFTIVNAPSAGTKLAPGASVQVEVGFMPLTAGAQTGSLRVTGDVPSSPLMIPLTGRGTMPGLALSRSEISFGQVPVGQSREGTFVVRNTGTSPLVDVAMQISGSNTFEIVSPTGSFIVAPGDSTVVHVRLTSQSQPGALAATVQVSSTGGFTSSVALSATIIRSSISTVSEVNFGSRTGGQNCDTTFVVRNQGTAPLRIDSIATGGRKDGVSGDYFRLLSGTPLSIAPGDTTTLALRFTPSGSGDYSGTLVLYTDNPVDGAVEMSLHATVESIAGIEDDAIVTGGLSLSLLPVAPNPASGSVDLSFSVAGTGRVPISLLVTDLRGSTLATIYDGSVDGNGSAREQKLHVDLGGLPSGGYYIVLKSEGRIAVEKFVVMR